MNFSLGEMSKYAILFLTLIAFVLPISIYSRIVFLFASFAGILYLVNFGERTDAFWVMAIFLINFIQLGFSIYKHKALKFKNSNEQVLYETSFKHFTVAQFKKLISIGEFISADAGEVLTELGKPVLHLLVLCKGKARVVVKGETIAFCSPGNLIGEMSFITHAPASATVYIVEPSIYFQWPQDKLRDLLNSDPELHLAMQTVFNDDFVKKHMPRAQG